FSSPSAKQRLRPPGISLFLFLFILRRCSPPFPDPSSLPLPLPLSQLRTFRRHLPPPPFSSFLVYIFSSIEPNENTDNLKSRPLPTRTMETTRTRALNPNDFFSKRRLLRRFRRRSCLPPHRRTAEAKAVSSSAEFLSLRRFPR
ncbi:unnamed protein product, partial [Musa acuminata var. zebrina]